MEITKEESCSSYPPCVPTNKTSRSDEWIWHYFTIYNGEFIKCNICFDVFNHDITHGLKMHMRSQHSAIYNNSETKWTHSKINHKLKCHYCDNSYEPIYRTDYLINHIKNSHKLNKEIANKLQTWVIDQFIIPKCEICKQFSKYHAFIFMIHLKKVHDVIVPQEFIPQRLSIRLKNLFDPCKNVENIPTSTSNNHQQPSIIRTYFKDYDPTFHSSDIIETSRSRDSWSWHYFTIYNGEFIKCNICFDVFNHDITHGLKMHMRSQHSAIYNNSETKWTHSKIDHKLKCHYCDKSYEPIYRTDYLINHIKNSHKLNKEIANKLQTWVIDQFIIPKCEICKQFSKYHAFIFMIHLKKVHDVIVPQEFIPQRLSIRLKNLFDSCKNVENIPTSTSNNHQQPSIIRTYFKDYDPTFHSSDTFELSHTSSNLLSSGNDTATSSSFYQSIVSTDLTDSEECVDMCDTEVEKFLECDKEESYSIIPVVTLLSHTSSNLLSSGNDTATSSSFYQSIVSTDLTDSEECVDMCDTEVEKFLECDKEESYSIIPVVTLLSHTSSNLLSSGNDTATSSSFYQSIVSTDLTDSEECVDMCDTEVEKFLECDKEESYSIIPVVTLLSNTSSNLLSSGNDTATSSSFYQSIVSTDLTDSEECVDMCDTEVEKFLECDKEESSIIPFDKY
ncbi:uncharacterized protein LOC114929208 isoform X3 [Nylanderia fulva]|uniref:uncharacterized protein LOC114929208 isoform X3 n=1 Tax=Nylanderia fulva TaxID=613905 RepID=UPI0010FAF6FB|nr:uncharacterized protein LOC114929208 isoform X3 [Nylanderia fulva]